MNRQRRNRQAGVTLIEMLVVVTIIALFAALVGPRLLRRGDEARITAARAQINALMNAVNMYKLDTGLYPTTEQGLEVLWQKPQNAKLWNGPYTDGEIPADPWGNEYVYRYPSEGAGDIPEIISYGADGEAGGEGIFADVVSWKNR